MRDRLYYKTDVLQQLRPMTLFQQSLSGNTMHQISSDSLNTEVFLAMCKEKILAAIERGENVVYCVGGGNDFLDALSAKFGHLLGNELRF